jgi:hypothetical protein
MTHLSNNKKYVPQYNILSLPFPSLPFPSLQLSYIPKILSSNLLAISSKLPGNCEQKFLLPYLYNIQILSSNFLPIHAQLASSCHPGPEVLKYILVN